MFLMNISDLLFYINQFKVLSYSCINRVGRILIFQYKICLYHSFITRFSDLYTTKTHNYLIYHEN